MSNSNNPKLNRSDPLIDEIRRIRTDISRKWGNDVDALCEHLQQAQKGNSRRIVSRKARRTRKAG
jgi:hypothetical protein